MITYSIYTRPINGLCYDFLDLYEVHVLSLLNQSYWRTMRMFSKNNVCEINLFQPFIYRTLKKKLPMRTWKDLIIFNHNYPPKNWNHVSREKKLPITLCLKSIGILFFCIISCNFKKTLLPNVSIEAVRTLIYC